MNITIEKQKYGPMAGLFQEVKFVIEALADDKDQRIGIRFLHAENNQLICTDGHRLHVLDLDPEVITVPDGNYSVRSGKDFLTLNLVTEEGITFPQWQQVYNVTGTKFEINSKEHFSEHALAFHGSKSELKSTINKDYLKPLEKMQTSWTMTYQDHLGPVRFDNCTKHAVIMPIRM